MKRALILFQTLLLTSTVSFRNTVAEEKPEARKAPEQAAESDANADPAEFTDETVVLTVDGTPITVLDVRELFTARYGRQFERMNPSERKLVERQVQQIVITDLISRILLLNAANEEGLQTSDEEVQENLAKIEAAIPDGISLEEYADQAGVSVERIKSQIVDEMKIQKLLAKVTSDIPEPAEEELETFFKENPDKFKQEEAVEASHILISTHDSDSKDDLAAKKALAEKIYGELEEENGENFADLVEKHSDCPSKIQGGNLGPIPKGKMPVEFETVAFSQKDGAISPPIKTEFGYHIIRTDGKVPARDLKFEEVRPVLVKWMMDQRKEKKKDEFVANLQDKAKIVRPGEENAEEAPAVQ